MLAPELPSRQPSSSFLSFSLVLTGRPLHSTAYSSPAGQGNEWPTPDSCIRYSMTPPLRLAAISMPLPRPCWKSRCALTACIPASPGLPVTSNSAVTRAVVSAALDPSPSFAWLTESRNSPVSSLISNSPLMPVVFQTCCSKSRPPAGGSLPIHSKLPFLSVRNFHSPSIYPIVRTV